jgi:hypothetical protein
LFVKDRSPEEEAASKQQRLDAGVAAAKAAVERFHGRRVGQRLLRPLLGAIKIRYRMQALEPVRQGQTWAIYGKVNPDKTEPTDVGTEGGDDEFEKIKAESRAIIDRVDQLARSDPKHKGFLPAIEQVSQHWHDTSGAATSDELKALAIDDFKTIKKQAIDLEHQIKPDSAQPAPTDEQKKEQELRRRFLDPAETRHMPASAYAKHTKGRNNEERKDNAKSAGQYLADLDDAGILALERKALANGQIVDRGGMYFIFYDCGQTVGYSAPSQQETSTIRVEWSSGFVHSHPR